MKGAEESGFPMGKRESIPVYTGGATRPDRPLLKGEDELLEKWKIRAAVLQVVGY